MNSHPPRKCRCGGGSDFLGRISPRGRVQRVRTAELNAVGQEPDVRKRLDTFTVEFSGLSGQAFADFARKERETLAPIIEKANIKPN
jgi:tripartite-type tricarboxylate transporter receptor subunit TctC